MPRIVSENRVTSRVTALDIHAPEITGGAEAGQIVLTRFDQDSSWRPKALAGVDREKGLLTVLSRDESRPGDTEVELSGPFGRSKISDKTGKVLFVAEGLGVGAVLPFLRECKEKGCYTMVIAGFPSKNDVFWIQRLNEWSDELYVVTDDGSYGIKGPVRQTLRAVCEQTADIDRVHAAGSLKFLKTTADVTRSFSIPATVSLATVFEDADAPIGGAGEEKTTPAAIEGVDWERSNDLDAHDIDFDSLARKLGLSTAK